LLKAAIHQLPRCKGGKQNESYENNGFHHNSLFANLTKISESIARSKKESREYGKAKAANIQ
jgi:hypothetical protein